MQLPNGGRSSNISSVVHPEILLGIQNLESCEVWIADMHMEHGTASATHGHALPPSLEEQDAVREEEHQPPEEEHAEGQQDVEDRVVVPRT